MCHALRVTTTALRRGTRATGVESVLSRWFSIASGGSRWTRRSKSGGQAPKKRGAARLFRVRSSRRAAKSSLSVGCSRRSSPAHDASHQGPLPSLCAPGAAGEEC
eukprot:scaffold2134_cov384-Prasinococcus_capsulatus_cf.AAC.1